MRHNRLILLVGARGFEPPTSCSQSRRAASLRHAPISLVSYHALIIHASLLKKSLMCWPGNYRSLDQRPLPIWTDILNPSNAALLTGLSGVRFLSTPPACPPLKVPPGAQCELGKKLHLSRYSKYAEYALPIGGLMKHGVVEHGTMGYTWPGNCRQLLLKTHFPWHPEKHKWSTGLFDAEKTRRYEY